MANHEIKLKIEKSKKQNQMRIQKMQMVDEYINKLKKETRLRLRKYMKNNPNEYKDLL